MTVVTRVLTLAITYDDTAEGADDLDNTDWHDLIQDMVAGAIVTEVACIEAAATDEELKVYKEANATDGDDEND